uniref:YqaJ viral recombinase domain-containing protein n=1 Tax=Amphimedon queenslandica TaxID=400682 RepID=A0A1X7U2J2_AMPQE
EGDDTTSNIWKAERRKRITSSLIGQIAKRRSKTKVEKVVKFKLYSTFRGNSATRWRNEQEKHARQKYIQKLKAKSPLATCNDSGLVIHKKHHWLAASPDGLVNDPSATPSSGLVEIKNPFKYKDSTILEAAEASDFCLKKDKNETIQLKKTHNYYYQVQGAMFCTDTFWCDFVVSTEKDLFVQRISFDRQFWETTITKLRTFYFTALLPQLAAPLNGMIREPEQWQSDPKSWEECYINL